MSEQVIVGMHLGHDASTCLLAGNEVLFDAQEERFTGIKHTAGFPYLSLQKVCETAKKHNKLITHLAVPTLQFLPEFYVLLGTNSKSNIPELKKPTLKSRIKNLLFNEKLTKLRPKTTIQFPSDRLHIENFLRENELQFPLFLKSFPEFEHIELKQFDHHHAHAASAYYSAPYSQQEKVLVLVLDGIGGTTASSIWMGANGELNCLARYGKSASFGFFYSLLTEVLKYKVLDGEGTVMGLAAYGKYQESIAQILLPYLPSFGSGFKLNPVESQMFNYSFSGGNHVHFSKAPFLQAELNAYKPEDIAATGQALMEKEVAKLVISCVEKYGINQLALAGGVAQNIKLNQYLRDLPQINEVFVFPNPGDAGLALGAALLARNINEPLLKLNQMPFWGSAYSKDHIKNLLINLGLQFEEPENIYDFITELLILNKSVAWFYGAMESGPRALGNRSILMSAANMENKNFLNEKVKYRESFRPFCPVMTEAMAHRYLKNYRGQGQYMTMSYGVTDAAKTEIPAAVHSDGTTRPQVVSAVFGSELFNLLLSYEKKGAHAALLNTSLNVKGMPIAQTPQDAIKCFFTSGLHILVLEGLVLRK